MTAINKLASECFDADICLMARDCPFAADCRKVEDADDHLG